MGFYYHLSSEGDDTNLQLYTLRRAYAEWKTLQVEQKDWGDSLLYIKERLVLTTVMFGLSVSQLLGQNAVEKKRRLDSPKQLLKDILDDSDELPEFYKDKIETDFNEFLKYYDACRHFGVIANDEKWNIIDSLDYLKERKLIAACLRIWRLILRTSEIEVGFKALLAL